MASVGASSQISGLSPPAAAVAARLLRIRFGRRNVYDSASRVNATPAAHCIIFFTNFSVAMVTGLVPHIGYEKAAAIAKIAFKTGRTVRDVATTEKILPADLIERILGPVTSGGEDAQ